MTEEELGYAPKKLYTLKEANAALPLVRVIVQDLQTLAKDIMERQQRLSALGHGGLVHAQAAGTAGTSKSGSAKEGGPARRQSNHFLAEEVQAAQVSIKADMDRVGEFLAELAELGVEAKGILEGLVDFPAWLDHRIVLLCWKLGEPEVRFWHELQTGFAGRKPTTGLIFTPAGQQATSRVHGKG